MSAGEKALLREFHETGTTLGAGFWRVSERTFREWCSDSNGRPVPRRVVRFIEGERAYDAGRLSTPAPTPEPGSAS